MPPDRRPGAERLQRPAVAVDRRDGSGEEETLSPHYYALSFEDYIAPKLDLIEPGDHASVRMTDSANFLAEHMAEVPVLVIPCVLDRPPEADGGEQQPGSGVASFRRCGASSSPCAAAASVRPGRRFTSTTRKRSATRWACRATVTQAALLPVAYYTGMTSSRRPAAPSRADLLGPVEGNEGLTVRHAARPGGRRHRRDAGHRPGHRRGVSRRGGEGRDQRAFDRQGQASHWGDG